MKPKDSPKFNINLGSFEGGESIDFENGVASSFYQQEAFDFRSKASQMSILPGGTALAASSNLVDLPVDMVQDPSGVRWIIGDQGNLYKLDVTNTITKVATLSSVSGYGIVYNQLSDMLYITGQQTVSLYGPVTTAGATPTFMSDLYGKSASSASGVVNLYDPVSASYAGTARHNAQNIATTQGITSTNQLTSTTAVNSYTAPNAISEASMNFCTFAPDVEPFYSISVYVKTKGTGSLTLTLHNGFNTALASVTILNAAIVPNAYNEFVFPAPGVRSFTGAIQSGLAAAYHFHITSSVVSDTTTVGTITASDLTGTNFALFIYRLAKTNNGWHPATIFTGAGFLLCIGNGQYLTTYNFSNDANPSNNVWKRANFPIDAGFEICGLSVNNQFLVIAAEKRSTNPNRSFQEGCLYFWDGQNATYNFKIQLPMGAPYSVYTFNNITYFICAGALFAWGGGQQVIKVRPIAYQNTDYLNATDTTYINPHMMAPRYNLLMVGYPSTTTNVNIRCGVYSWGSVELIYPNSFGYSYRLSSGIINASATNNLRIGMIMNFVDTMYIASSSVSGGVTTYNLDVINNSSTPAANFNWASLIYDGGVRYKQKMALRYKVNFLPWPAGATLNLWYAFERNARITADPTTGATYSPATGATSVMVDIPAGRFYEAQWGFTGTCSSPTSVPTITGIDFEVDPLGSEADLRYDQNGG